MHHNFRQLDCRFQGFQVDGHEQQLVFQVNEFDKGKVGKIPFPWRHVRCVILDLFLSTEAEAPHGLALFVFFDPWATGGFFGGLGCPHRSLKNVGKILVRKGGKITQTYKG